MRVSGGATNQAALAGFGPSRLWLKVDQLNGNDFVILAAAAVNVEGEVVGIPDQKGAEGIDVSAAIELRETTRLIAVRPRTDYLGKIRQVVVPWASKRPLMFARR